MSSEDEWGDEDECTAIVIDAGSGFTKAGPSGSDEPMLCFPTVVGHLKAACKPAIGAMIPAEDVHPVGEAAMARRGICNLERPIQGGVVHCWDGAQAVYRHALAGLGHTEAGSELSDEAVMLTYKTPGCAANDEMPCQVMFEQFGASRFSLQNQSTLAMYAAGRSTALVVDFGFDCTTVQPSYEGFSLPHAFRKLELGGNTLDGYMRKMLGAELQQPGVTFEDARQVKEKLCYLSMDFGTDLGNFGGKEKVYELPDLTELTVQNQLIRCPELLFSGGHPADNDFWVDSTIVDEVYHCVGRCDVEIQTLLRENIVVCGGGSMFPNLPERLAADLKANYHPHEVNVVAGPDRDKNPWIGGSIISSMPHFQSQWVTRALYNDYGSRAIFQFSH